MRSATQAGNEASGRQGPHAPLPRSCALSAEWRPEYACYKDATCERQSDGTCGWTQTEAVTACLASPPSE